jgi:hypothetical protein
MSNVASASHAKEPPLRPQGRLFVVGQDCRGNWVVKDPSGISGGLFVGREAALRYLRREIGDQAVVVSPNAVECDFVRNSVPPAVRRVADARPQRLRINQRLS